MALQIHDTWWEEIKRRGDQPGFVHPDPLPSKGKGKGGGEPPNRVPPPLHPVR